MKVSLLILACAGIILLGFATRNKSVGKQMEPVKVPGSYNPVVVLELFTSEGCSSCPPADNLLPELARSDSNIIPLSFHVDYWNRLGWTDPFSNPEYSDRQWKYADHWRLESVYTPELVINGEYEVVGSNQSQAEASIKKVLKEKSKVKINIDTVKISDRKIHLSCHSDGEWKKTDLIAVLVQKNAVMKVNSGENKGATLSHINVVRSFAIVKSNVKNEFELTVPANLVSGNWGLVVYAQQQTDFKITGAVKYDPNRK